MGIQCPKSSRNSSSWRCALDVVHCERQLFPKESNGSAQGQPWHLWTSLEQVSEEETATIQLWGQTWTLYPGANR